MTTWINVNKHVIARNARTGENNPPIRISKGKRGKPPGGLDDPRRGTSAGAAGRDQPGKE